MKEKEIKKILKIRKSTNLSFVDCLKIVRENKPIYEFIKKKIKENYNLFFVKSNKKRNLVLVLNFIFESDLFMKNIVVLKCCKKILKNLFNYFFKKNKLIRKQLIRRLIRKLILITNEKVIIKLKCLYSKKNEINYYIHMGKEISLLKTARKMGKKIIKDILFHIIFSKPKNYYFFKNQEFVKNNSLIVKEVIKSKKLLIKKYYFNGNV